MLLPFQNLKKKRDICSVINYTYISSSKSTVTDLLTSVEISLAARRCLVTWSTDRSPSHQCVAPDRRLEDSSTTWMPTIPVYAWHWNTKDGWLFIKSARSAPSVLRRDRYGWVQEDGKNRNFWIWKKKETFELQF